MPHADTIGLNANVGVKEKWPGASVVDDVLDVGVGVAFFLFFFCCRARCSNLCDKYVFYTK